MWITGNSIVDTLAKIRNFGLEYTHRRFYSKYKGTVELNLDAQQQGRIKISCSDTGKVNIDPTGTIATPETYELYSYPSSPFAGDNYGFYFPPEVGDRVWVWFDHGDPTQPNYSGGWWLNPGDPSNEAAKTSGTSQLPVEFKHTDGIPTTRGIKTKRGHGMWFEDDVIKRRDTGIKIWTGEAQTPPAAAPGGPAPPALAAKVRHSFTMSDRDQEVHLITYGPGPKQAGHETVWDDFPDSQGVRTITIYGHTIDMDDVAKSITIKTKLGHQVVLDDTANSITAKTVAGNTAVMSDPLQTISLTTTAQQSVVMNDTALTINITTLGTTNVTAATGANVTTLGAATVTSGGATTVTAGGIISLIAQGVNITSEGTAPCATVGGGVMSNTFTGLVTNTLNGGIDETVNGPATQTVSGPWTVVSNAAIIGGQATPKFFLVTEEFFTAHNTHTHAMTAGLGPPDKLIVPPTSPLAPIPDPAVAPNIDERLVLTADLKAS